MADQSAGNYGYDEIGNLIKDEAEEIQEIKWTVYGKVKSVIRETGSTKPDLDFRYNAMGQRYLKVVRPKNGDGTPKNSSYWKITFYQHDAQGNVLAVYDIANRDGECGYEMYLGQHVLYGSSRLGVSNYDLKLGIMEHSFPGYSALNSWICLEEEPGDIDLLAGTTTAGGGTGGGANTTVLNVKGPGKVPGTTTPVTGINLPWAEATTKPQKEPVYFKPGKKQYEFSNHLGNVLVTVSDMPIGVDEGDNGTVDYYMPDVLTASDYEPFGAPLEGRTESETASYRFSFNGQERSDEVYGEGNSTTAEFWQYDTRIGRRWNMDPKPRIGISDYSVFEGDPITFNDPLGDRIIGTRQEKRALRQRSDWAQIRAMYRGRNSIKDLTLHQEKDATDNILNATIDLHPPNRQKNIDDNNSDDEDPGRMDYLSFTPLTRTVTETRRFFGIDHITAKPVEKQSRNRFISGVITIWANSNDGFGIRSFGMDRITVNGGSSKRPIFDQEAGPVSMGVLPIVAVEPFDYSSDQKAEKITMKWSNDRSPSSGPFAGYVIIQVVGLKYVDKRFINNR